MFITALYAGLLAPLFVFLSARVIRYRRDAKVAVGDGGNSDLLRRMRVHSNFAEYVPFALLLMALAESVHTRPWLVHLAGIALVAGRVAHAYGVSQTPEPFAFRVWGTATIFTVIGLMAASCLFGALLSSH
jgi:uncharacterized protein